MTKGGDIDRLGEIYSESVGLGPNAESPAALGAPIQTRIESEDAETEDLMGKTVTWKDAIWIVTDQQGVNVKLVKLSDDEAVAPARDVKVTPKQIVKR